MAPRFIECEQNSPEWYRERLGIPTASNFGAILAKGEGKMRKSYLHRLAAEIITGETVETFYNGDMKRGHDMESEARDLYAFVNDAPLQRVGFVRNGPNGASPDSLIGGNGGLEIKTQRSDLLVGTILDGRFPSEHKAQVQGTLWICEREWWDLCIYWPKMPLFIQRAHRDEAYIKNLADEVGRFNEDLAALVQTLRGCSDEVKAA